MKFSGLAKPCYQPIASYWSWK